MRVVIACIGLLLALAGLAEPNIVVFKYNKVDANLLPTDLIIGNNQTFFPWVRDDAKWPVNKRIALLVHGFPLFSPGTNRYGLLDLAAHLSKERNIDNTIIPAYDSVYAVEYPEKYSISDTAFALDDIVHERCSNLPIGTKIDIFAHSMGGWSCAVLWKLNCPINKH